jgi:hypothetical protein
MVAGQLASIYDLQCQTWGRALFTFVGGAILLLAWDYKEA